MTQPAGLASLNHGTGTVLYGRGQLGSIRLKTSQPPAFSFIAVLILWYIYLLIQYNVLVPLLYREKLVLSKDCDFTQRHHGFE